MSQNICKWFSKSSSSKGKKKAKAIQPNIPNLTPGPASGPSQAPAPQATQHKLSDCEIPPVPIPKPRPLSTLQPQKKTIKVFTDGSTINNGKRVEIVSGGVGVYFGKNDARNISKKVISKKVTNNVCELMACILAIEQVILSEDTMDFVEIKIYSDSEYTINSVIKWADNWEKNNYKKKVKGKWVDIKNVVYIKKLREYYKKYNVKFYHTPAHKAQPDPRKDKEKYDQWYGNYMADHLARCASQN